MLISRSLLAKCKHVSRAGQSREPILGVVRRIIHHHTRTPFSTSGVWHSRSISQQTKLYSAGQGTKNDLAAIDTKSWRPPIYTVPARGILSVLPKAWVPYAELVRLDKPAGTIYLFFPCLFSTLLAAIHSPSITPGEIFTASALFLTGAFIMRGAGCTINDLWDRNLDPLVQRTALRPLARRAITPRAAIVFTGFQLSAGLALLLQFPTSCLFYGIPSLALVVIYPLAKRVTHYPQFVLGLAFSWGAFMGFPALGLSLVEDLTALKTAIALYSSCVLWTVLYDMIYAHMDIKDDKKAGIKSIALRHDEQTKKILAGLAAGQVGLLATCGWLVDAGTAYYLLSCGGALATLGNMILRVDLKSTSDCWWWFTTGAWLTGGAISIGMVAEYVQRRRMQQSGVRKPEIV